jgi:hypothetical protein
VFLEVVVGFDQQTSDEKRRNGPLPLLVGEAEGGCPKIPLVENEILGKRFEIDCRRKLA